MTQQLIHSKSIKDILAQDAVKARFKEILGERGPQFAASLVQLVNQSQQLQKCDPNSVIGCALMAASLDLSIDPNLGHAAVVPYDNKAQFQIMRSGFTQLALRTNQYRNLGEKVVHEGELEKWDELTGELEVNDSNPDGEIIGYAAKFRLTGGFERGLYWTLKKCMAHAERYSKAYRAALNDERKQQYAPWFTHRDEMCLKTVLRTLLRKWGPTSIQMQKALKADEGAVINADTGEVEYLDSTSANEVVLPVFDDSPKEAKTESTKPEAKLQTPTKKPEVEKAEEAQVKSGFNRVKALHGFLTAAGLQDAEVINYLKVTGVSEAKKLDEIPDELMDVLIDGQADLVQKVKEAKANG